MIFHFKPGTDYDARVIYEMKVIEERDDEFLVYGFGDYNIVKKDEIEIMEEIK